MSDLLSDPAGQPAVGLAFYQLGELYRLRGEFSDAEAAYREASRHGREPQPGLSRLRLMQGDAAGAVIRRVLKEPTRARARSTRRHRRSARPQFWPVHACLTADGLVTGS